MEGPLERMLISSRSINKHGHHRQFLFLIGRFKKIFSSETAWPNEPKPTWSPHAILVSDWSISKKSSPLKLLSHMNRNLVGSIYMYGRFCIKFPQSRMKGERHWASSYSSQCLFCQIVLYFVFLSIHIHPQPLFDHFIFVRWICHWTKSIPLTCLNLPHCCACPKPGPGVSTLFVEVFFFVHWVKMKGYCLFCMILMELLTILCFC